MPWQRETGRDGTGGCTCLVFWLGAGHKPILSYPALARCGAGTMGRGWAPSGDKNPELELRGHTREFQLLSSRSIIFLTSRT